MDGFDAKVAELTRATTTLLSNVNVSATSLNADASTASTKASDTATNTADALAYRNTAETYKDNTATYSATATGTVSYSGIAAIAESKAVTAVDVFVYDTSKDSDGGAWRHRCQHTSWYNETLNTATRGSRKEFPAVAVIVATSGAVTIYDGDDPTLPMWMVFNTDLGGSTSGWNDLHYLLGSGAYPITSITAKNGSLLSSTKRTAGENTSYYYGLTTINLISDDSYGYGKTDTYPDFGGYQKWGGNISERNEYFVHTKLSNEGLISGLINDIAMTVLPDAPIDQATGLPIPTIAVATNGGVSVIKDNGTVVDWQTVNMRGIDITDSELFVAYGLSGRFYVDPIPTSNVAYGSVSAITARHYRTYSAAPQPSEDDLFYLDNGVEQQVANHVVLPKDELALAAFSSGLTKIAENRQTPSKGMVSYITSDYNTGWMVGDIQGAFLSDTDTTSLVGSGELVTNGTFDTDTSGWTAIGQGSLSVVSGAMRVLNDDPFTAGSSPSGQQAISTIIGQTYVVTVDVVSTSTGNSGLGASQYSGGTSRELGEVTSVGAGSYEFTFIATSTTTYIKAFSWSIQAGEYADFDNISVRLADADRSVNNKGLVINGTITRTPVATGADLVAYSGFNSSNYLEQPYNSDLDFGTGDFCYCVWINRTSNSVLTRLGGRADGIDDHRFEVYLAQYSDFPVFYVEDNNVASFVQSSIAVSHNAWTLITAVRESNVFSIYVNGKFGGSVSKTVDLTTENNASFFVGGMSYNGGVSVGTYAANTSLALFRISATAPSAEQIAKIYEDEKVLFTEGAQATLYGTSSAVTALAYDEDTELLHVGTSQGRSVFQGLARVDNTTTSVDKAISAVDGLVVEE